MWHCVPPVEPTRCLNHCHCRRCTRAGWGTLDIQTFGNAGGWHSRTFSDQTQHQAAGLIEGFLTAREIYPNYLNNLGFTFGDGGPPQAVVKFLADQEAWAKAQAADRAQTDPVWAHVAAVLAQFDGLVKGYQLYSDAGGVGAPPIDRFGLQMLNAIGDLFQIVPAVSPSARIDWSRLGAEQKRRELRRQGHCSALIKVTGAFEDLLMAHSSWFEYGDMNRIFKHYSFAFDVQAGAHRISFSSYPGYLESLDDFYMMDSGLGMVQTSNGVMNNSLYDLIKPQSLLAWQRVRAVSVETLGSVRSTFRFGESPGLNFCFGCLTLTLYTFMSLCRTCAPLPTRMTQSPFAMVSRHRHLQVQAKSGTRRSKLRQVGHT